MPTVYRYCGKCGLKFRKRSYPKGDCPRCGGEDLWEENIPQSDLSLVDDVIDEMFREKYADIIQSRR